jgi:hypothetical protein
MKISKARIISFIVVLIIFAYQGYEAYKTQQVVHFLNSFSDSDHCMVTMADGKSIRIDGDHWQTIVSEDISMRSLKKGKNLYHDQSLDLVMTLNLYDREKILSTMDIYNVVSSKEKLKKLNNLTNEHKELRVHYAYDQIKDMRIVTVNQGNYYVSLYEFLIPLFKEIEVFM